MASEVVLVRHGETEWSLSGRHTGSTDIPLTDKGRKQAQSLLDPLKKWDFSLVLVSPLARAQETARLAGIDGKAITEENLREWNYGEYEGRTTANIRKEIPNWTIFTGKVFGGETADEVGARADQVIERVDATDGAVALVAHGHILRILGARWMGLPAINGSHLGLGTATLSVLGYERETKVITQWNAPPVR
jgi:probable phosphoglycerate mutase